MAATKEKHEHDEPEGYQGDQDVIGPGEEEEIPREDQQDRAARRHGDVVVVHVVHHVAGRGMTGGLEAQRLVGQPAVAEALRGAVRQLHCQRAV